METVYELRHRPQIHFQQTLSHQHHWHLRDIHLILRFCVDESSIFNLSVFAKPELTLHVDNETTGGFHCSALKAWNDLPANLRELPTQNSFKKQLKTYLKG